jgi:hypothetical protein
MASETLYSARQELQELRKSLESDPRYRRAKILERFIAELEAINDSDATPRVRCNPIEQNDHAFSKKSKQDQIKEIAKQTIESNGFASKKLILQNVRAHGIEVSDIAISSYLSRFDEFVPDRKKGWGLKQPSMNNGLFSPGDESAGAATPAGFQNGSTFSAAPIQNEQERRG